MPPQLEAEDCPEELRYLWEYFLSMNLRRTSNGTLPNALSPEAVLAWAKLRAVTLSAFEVETLDRIEQLYLRYHSEAALNRMKQPHHGH